jgi:hypothetical protein
MLFLHTMCELCGLCGHRVLYLVAGVVIVATMRRQLTNRMIFAHSIVKCDFSL